MPFEQAQEMKYRDFKIYTKYSEHQKLFIACWMNGAIYDKNKSMAIDKAKKKIDGFYAKANK